jgi:NAD-dependent deacetylase
MTKQKLVVLSGAGMSAESGIPTFRASDGLWENHRIEDVASPEGWARNPALVLEFYNQRRRQIRQALPNDGHRCLAALEAHFEVHVVTQNIDDLHERAGSTRVLHLHGEILKVRSTRDDNLIYPWTGDLLDSDRCALGSPLRPHIVWFGEAVPMMEQAARLVSQADILVVVGTSLVVYPAASLLRYAPPAIPKYLVDPGLSGDSPAVLGVRNLTLIASTAARGLPELARTLAPEWTAPLSPGPVQSSSTEHRADNPWTLLSQREVYDNAWIRLVEHQVLNPAGKPGIYGVVHYKNLAIGVIPVQGMDTWLVGQYRFPFNAYSWEIVAGGGSRDESPEEGARRELLEETGLMASRLELIQEMQLSNSVGDEVGLIYLATGLVQQTARPTDDEQLEVARIPLREAIERVYRGELTDSLTVAGLLKLEAMMARGAFTLPA